MASKECQYELPSLAKKQMISRAFPDRPFQHLALDFTQFNGQDYLTMIACYGSKLAVQFQGHFCFRFNDLGCTDILRRTMGSQGPPIAVRARRPPTSVQEEIQEMLDDQLNCDIIPQSRSHWYSPVLVVTKSNGKKHLCIYFRKLISVTTRVFLYLVLKTCSLFSLNVIIFPP